MRPRFTLRKAISVIIASGLSYLVKPLGGRNKSLGTAPRLTFDKVRVSGTPPEGH